VTQSIHSYNTLECRRTLSFASVVVSYTCITQQTCQIWLGFWNANNTEKSISDGLESAHNVHHSRSPFRRIFCAKQTHTYGFTKAVEILFCLSTEKEKERGLRKRMKKEKRKSNLVRQHKREGTLQISIFYSSRQNGNGLSFFVNL